MLSKESFISSKILFEETFQCVTKVVMERSKKTSKSLDFRQECLPLFYTTVDWTLELLLSGKIISIGLFNGILETKYMYMYIPSFKNEPKMPKIETYSSEICNFFY